MGWTVSDFGTRGLTPDQYLRKQCEYDRTDKDGRFACKILASAMVGTTWYAAAHIISPAHGEREARDLVTAFVWLTSRRGWFGYKDMCESMGPCYYDCPARILALLSPAEVVGSYAAEWRAQCAEVAKARGAARKARPSVGDTVTFAEPVRYSGKAIQSFRIMPTPARRRGLVGTPADGRGGLYRLPVDRLATAEIVKAAGA